VTGTPRHVLASIALATALSLAACSSDGGDEGNGSPVPPTTPGTEAPATLPPNIDPTPGSLDEARQALVDQLDAIGANIGAVPPDIQRGIIEDCETLEEFADGDTVGAICSDIQRAMDTNDPGLVDGVLRRLGELEAG
jgi:hypothetical protein